MSIDISPVCYSCQQLYSQCNPPRVIPRCLHSYCQRCLSTLKSCPRDRTLIDLTKKPFNINLLALNNALKETDVNIKMCLLHNKPLDLVCMDDSVSICSICALFGEHKHHNIKTDKQVVMESASMAESIVITIDRIKKLEIGISMQAVKQQIENKISSRQMELAKEIKAQYRKLMDRIRKVQTASLTKLHQMFLESTRRVVQQLNVQEVVKRKDQWILKAQRLLGLIGQQDIQGNIQVIQKYVNPKYSENDLSKDGIKLISDLQYFSEVYPQRISKVAQQIQYSVNNNIQKSLQQFIDVYQHESPKSYLAQSISTIQGYITERRQDTNLLIQQHEILYELTQQDEHNSTFKSIQVSQRKYNAKNNSIIKTRGCSVSRSINENSFSHRKSVSKMQRSRITKIPEKYLSIFQDLKNNRCEILDLGGAELGDQVIIALCQGIKFSQKLKTIKLVRNKLTDDVIWPLISACWNVTTINLGQNSITNKALDILSEVDLKYITTLVLSQNRLKQRICKEKINEFKKLGLNISV